MHPRLPDRPVFDDEAGPLVRPYQATGGRVVADAKLELITLVTACGACPRHLDDPHREIIDLSLCPISIAELSGKMRLPAMAVKVLVSDLLHTTAVAVTTPDLIIDVESDKDVLEALLHGLQRRL